MDLVDIDQVLDNLEAELKADEQLTKNAASVTLNCKSRDEARPLGDGSAGAGAAAKSFVGVSQVFNSLNDYRNNVKSLETHESFDWSAEQPQEQQLEQEEQDEDEETHEDLNKFSEAKEKQNKQADETTISSTESLTTSSCSTFSSGPSPGNSEEQALESALELLAEEQPEEQQAANAQPQDSVGVDDLAVGLSSISITQTSQSMHPCEVTASSALGKVLNELSEESSTELEPQSQPVAAAVDNKDKLPEPAPTLPAESKPQADELPKRSQPITFCSTMDEISDTELDSMLQEVEVDIDIEEEEVVAMPTQGMLEEEEDDDGTTASPATEEESVRILSDQETNSADQNNVDNFSQASTVEFAELRVQQQEAEQQPAKPVDTEELGTSFSSSGSETDSLSGRKLEEEQEAEAQEAVAVEALESRPQRPQSLQLNGGYVEEDAEQQQQAMEQSEQECSCSPQAAAEEDDDSPIYEAVGYGDPHANLGKVPPIWVPDNMAGQCMQCQQKFTMIKRRHHCRACGKVLCSVCCSQRFHLPFANEPESRVCVQCFMILTERQTNGGVATVYAGAAPAALPPTPMRSPNPNNPMEYCSTIPPHCQVSTGAGAPPPSVIVPVGVLKKTDGSSSNSSSSDGKQRRKRKSVMFSDGIAPGSELASTMEQQWGEAKQARRGVQRSNSGAQQKPPTPGATSTSSSSSSIDSSTALGLVAQLFRGSIPPSAAAATLTAATKGIESNESANRKAAQISPRRKLPPSDAHGCFIPFEEHALPPICVASREGSNCDVDYKMVRNDADLLERLQHETLKFMLKNNFYVLVKVLNMSCCMNRWVLNFTTCGMHHVGNDELIILLEIAQPPTNNGAAPVPRDIFQHLYEIYAETEHAHAGTQELSFTSPRNPNFLGSREHGGFIYIRPTYQCLQGVILPDNPYLVGVLIHRHEVPWAKVLPLRLILRLGAQYRYYPCPLISVRSRESVYGEIAQTIINFLVDFRNYTYSLPAIRGLYIHMEDRQTTVTIPRYRQHDVIKAINNATDHILAFAGNFSKLADGHLVCMQNVNDDRAEMFAYSTQAINIQGQPRKITGASFFVLNESLKSSSGLSGKCSIVEDGLMVQVMPAKMEEVRQALRNQTDIDIVCGPIAASDEQSETVSIKWVDAERDINVGVKSCIDERAMDGVGNMRSADWYATNGNNYGDITRIAEQLARSASMALLPYLDLLAAAGINKLSLRATLDQENVCYEAGARGSKLAPLYMNALDNHLIPTLHSESSGIQDSIILELVFYILNA
ncbi:Sara [Drosophila busckii]|uniref:Zinc finger FYVE domain-containing protein n=1 Tax=Drosophila busckii TaxID=30019 RepID=A0A0M4EBN2_DROBS|nr:Sara [Drosophila busckii]